MNTPTKGYVPEANRLGENMHLDVGFRRAVAARCPTIRSSGASRWD